MRDLLHLYYLAHSHGEPEFNQMIAQSDDVEETSLEALKVSYFTGV